MEENNNPPDDEQIETIEQVEESTPVETPRPKLTIDQLRYQVTQLPYVLFLSFTLFDLSFVRTLFVDIFSLTSSISLILAMFGFFSLSFFVPKLCWVLWTYGTDNGFDKLIIDIKKFKFETPQKIAILISYCYFLFGFITSIIHLFLLAILHINFSLVYVALVPMAVIVPVIDMYLLYCYRERILGKISWIPKTQLMLKLFTAIIGIISVLILVVYGFILFSKIYSIAHPAQIACTMEAKICPDGSAVGRTGPSCEFQKCPAPKTDDSRLDSRFDNIANWKTYTNNEFNFSIEYPTASLATFEKGGGAIYDNVTITLPMINSNDAAEKQLVVLFRKTDQTASDEVEERLKQHDQDKTSTVTERILKVGNNNFEELITNFPDQKIKKIQVFTDHNGILYQFQINTSIKNDAITETLLLRLLSTFKFTK